MAVTPLLTSRTPSPHSSDSDNDEPRTPPTYVDTARMPKPPSKLRPAAAPPPEPPAPTNRRGFASAGFGGITDRPSRQGSTHYLTVVEVASESLEQFARNLGFVPPGAKLVLDVEEGSDAQLRSLIRGLAGAKPAALELTVRQWLPASDDDAAVALSAESKTTVAKLYQSLQSVVTGEVRIYGQNRELIMNPHKRQVARRLFGVLPPDLFSSLWPGAPHRQPSP